MAKKNICDVCECEVFFNLHIYKITGMCGTCSTGEARLNYEDDDEEYKMKEIKNISTLAELDIREAKVMADYAQYKKARPDSYSFPHFQIEAIKKRRKELEYEKTQPKT